MNLGQGYRRDMRSILGMVDPLPKGYRHFYLPHHHFDQVMVIVRPPGRILFSAKIKGLTGVLYLINHFRQQYLSTFDLEQYRVAGREKSQRFL
jgi:hypothetical protein